MRQFARGISQKIGQNFGDILIITGIFVLAVPLIWSLRSSYLQDQEQINWQQQAQNGANKGQTDARTWPPTRIIIKRTDLSAVVVEGKSDKDLDRGPMHIAGTALPGQFGNCCIAAHKEKWFRRLRDVRVGDLIVLETRDKKYTYHAIEQKTVSPSDTTVMNYTVEPTLTLITCTGVPYGGSKHRLIVVGKLGK